jgi:N-acetylneuraminate lyase
VVLNGRDEQLAASLLLGANGGIGTFYNIFPRLLVDIFKFAQGGNWHEAARLQLLINPVLKKIFDAGLLQATRAVLEFQGFACGEALLPRASISSADLHTLRQAVDALPLDVKKYLIRA